MKQHNIYISNTPLDKAQELWFSALSDCGFFSQENKEKIAVDDALGRITAAPVFAACSSPAHNAAAMDGIAVFFSDVSNASEASPVILRPERYQRVNTGNAIPDRMNAVIKNEDLHFLDDDSVQIHTPVAPWKHVRTLGEDIVATELLLAEGHTIRPIDQGAMLATGVTEVEVVRVPKAVVIPTGNELIEPGQAPQPGEIIEFNSRILAGYLTTWGAETKRTTPVSDDPVSLEKTLLQAAKDNDFVLLNAGASAGSYDFSAMVLEKIGTIIVHGVAIKPGKPIILALVGNTPVIGLPGYPISAVLTMRLFVRNMLTRLLNRKPDDFGHVEATLSRPIHSAMGVDEFIRITLGKVGNTLMATPAGKGAGSVMSMVRADALLTIPAGSEGIGAGETVPMELIRPQTEIDATLVIIGSHDNILDILANTLHKQRPVIRVSSAHVGSMGGIMAIRRGEAHIAGTHLLDETTGEYNTPFIKQLLPNVPLQLIHLCYREQGLIVAPGNPKNIKDLGDMAARSLSFINRQSGSGTRLLTDKMLKDSKINTSTLPGYECEEYTHMSVAAAVASGNADAGMGIKAAATALGLDFIPVAEERYDLIVPKIHEADQKIITTLDIICNDENFQKHILSLGGYSLRDTGKLLYQQ